MVAGHSRACLTVAVVRKVSEQSHPKMHPELLPANLVLGGGKKKVTLEGMFESVNVSHVLIIF